MKLKRDNWTNKEVKAILEGELMNGRGPLPNLSLQNAIERFDDFTRPETETGAMALDLETNDIIHVGPPLPR